MATLRNSFEIHFKKFLSRGRYLKVCMGKYLALKTGFELVSIGVGFETQSLKWSSFLVTSSFYSV